MVVTLPTFPAWRYGSRFDMGQGIGTGDQQRLDSSHRIPPAQSFDPTLFGSLR